VQRFIFRCSRNHRVLLRITCCLRQLSCRERADPSPLSRLTSLTPHSHSPHHERVTPPHTFAVPCNRPLDMVILLDESGSVNNVEWNQGIDFVEKFVTEINGGGGGSRIGQGTSQIRISLVAWAQQDQQQTIIKFSDAANLNALLALLSSNNVRAFRGSRTCTGVAAKFAATSVIAASSGNVRIVLVKRRGAEGGGGGGGEGTTKLALPPRKLLLPSNQYATLSPSLSPAHLDSAAPSFHALLTHDRILTTHIYSHTTQHTLTLQGYRNNAGGGSTVVVWLTDGAPSQATSCWTSSSSKRSKLYYCPSSTGDSTCRDNAMASLRLRTDRIVPVGIGNMQQIASGVLNSMQENMPGRCLLLSLSRLFVSRHTRVLPSPTHTRASSPAPLFFLLPSPPTLVTVDYRHEQRHNCCSPRRGAVHSSRLQQPRHDPR